MTTTTETPTTTTTSAVAEHAFTLPMALALITALCTATAGAGFFPPSSPWFKLLMGIAGTLPVAVAQLGQLWQSLHVRTRMAETPASVSPVEVKS